jgi:hypothetical protein
MPQLGWPQVHIISTFWATPSQWALQYLALLGGTQVQAAFPHFLGAAIDRLLGHGRAAFGHFDAICGKKLARETNYL